MSDPTGPEDSSPWRPADPPGEGMGQPAGPSFQHGQPAAPPPGGPGIEGPASQATAPIHWAQPPDGPSTPVEPTMVVPIGPPPAAKVPQRRRRGLVIGIVVVVVLAALVAADRITPIVLGRSVGHSLQSELGTSTAPQVRFDGFPFLNQLATKNFREVEVTAHDVTSQQLPGAITVRTVTADLHGVTVSDNQIKIDSADGSALLDYQAVSTLVGHTVSYAGDNKIKINLLAGVAITASVGVDQQEQQVVLSDVKLDSANTPGFANQLVERIVNSLLPALSLPTGIRLTGIQVGDDGVRVQGTGENLTMPR
ncbi:DUF2993 domain-containing protein [Microlunatus elymi]|uniref:DUF2993 domain-containing protein n=1 Tax=Microlunatus elymi TaxID=2596828 RepID=A0A516PYN6_9ACTN|nr:DUF2993 domain-containing protein [Microlunatus elymi]QDP96299.1 DUF2993 domain-containing protein [Microlunatus elymi]